jgi:rfaE bifunctional protein kinase chain/domain
MSRARDLIGRFAGVRVVVAGDLLADEFIYGKIDRVSREAPVLILSYDSTKVVPGGAGNAASNAAALGARVDVIGVVGRDGAGDRLIQALPPRSNLNGIVRVTDAVTPVKTRILAGGVHSAKQQVVRIDRAGTRPSAATIGQVERRLARAIRSADVVILSDYGNGLVTPGMWQRVLRASGLGRVPPTVVDSRYGLAGFRKITACTPNESEVEALAGVKIDDRRDVLERAGRQLLDTLDCDALLITRGSRGMALFERDAATDHIPIVGSDEIADVTGAGDTVIAVFSVAIAAGATFGEAARLANYAGGLVVMKRGTATVTADELRRAVGDAPLASHRRRAIGRS